MANNEDGLQSKADALLEETRELNKNTVKKIEASDQARQASDDARAASTTVFKLLLILILVVLAANGVATIFSIRAANRSSASSQANHQVLAAVNETLSIIKDAVNPSGCLAAKSGYIQALTIWDLKTFIANQEGNAGPPKPKPPVGTPAACKPAVQPTPTVTKTDNTTRTVPGPTKTVIITRCVRPSGRPCN